jgi:hypothetical protein
MHAGYYWKMKGREEVGETYTRFLGAHTLYVSPTDQVELAGWLALLGRVRDARDACQI